MELATPTAAQRHRTVSASYLPTKQVEPQTAPARIEIVTQSSTLDYAQSWAGYKLTPDRLNWIFLMADLGSPYHMYDTFESLVLSDGKTRGLYEQALDEMCVAWSWRPGDDRPGSAQAADDIAAATASIDMEGAIEHLALQTFYGSSYVEVAWVTGKGGLQVPAELVCVPHRRFVFDEESRPRLTSEKNAYPGDLLERRPGSSWIIAETRRWRRQVQAGILRTVAWWCMFKRMSVRDWLIFAEKFGIPMIVAKLGENASETTRAKVKEMLAALGTEGRAVLGSDVTIDVLTQALRAGGTGDHVHAGIVALANAEIAQAITAGTLTSDTSGPGSFALGEIHALEKHKLSLARARRIGGWFRKGLAMEYLVRNRLTDRAAAPFCHMHVQKLSLKEDSEVVKNLTGAGMVLSQSQMRERFELRAASGPDDELKMPTPPAPGAKNAEAANPPAK